MCCGICLVVENLYFSCSCLWEYFFFHGNNYSLQALVRGKKFRLFPVFQHFSGKFGEFVPSGREPTLARSKLQRRILISLADNKAAEFQKLYAHSTM